MAVAGLVLAAGESTRMGRPKALLDWGGRTLLQVQIDALTAAGSDPVVVVLGARAHQVRARTRCEPPCRLVENAAFRGGRATSVRVGAIALDDAVDAVLITSVDGPTSAETAQALIADWRSKGGAIVVPRYAGRNGHPALFSGALLPELRAVQESTLGLKALRTRHAHATRFVDLDDPWVTLNLNTPEEYAAARAAFEG